MEQEVPLVSQLRTCPCRKECTIPASHLSGTAVRLGSVALSVAEMPKGPRLCRLPMVSQDQTNQARSHPYTPDARSLKPRGEACRHSRPDPTAGTSASAFRRVGGNGGDSSYSKSFSTASATRCAQLARTWSNTRGVQKELASYEIPTSTTVGLTHTLGPWDTLEEVATKSDDALEEMLKTNWPVSAAAQLTALLREDNEISDAQTKRIIETAHVYVEGGDLIQHLKDKISTLITLINECPFLNTSTNESFGYGELATTFEAVVEGLASVQHDMLSNEYKRSLWRSERLKPLLRRFLDQLDDEDRELIDFLSLSRCRVEASLGRHILKVSQALVKFHGKIVDSKHTSKALRAIASRAAEMGMCERDSELNSASLATRVHQFREGAMRQSELMERNLAMQEKFNKSIATEAAMIRNWLIKDGLQDTLHHTSTALKRTMIVFDDVPEAIDTQEMTRKQNQPQWNEQQEQEPWHTNLDLALTRQLARSKRVLHDMEKLDVDKQMYLEDLDVLLSKEYEMANSVCSPQDGSSPPGAGSGPHNLEGSDDVEMVLNELVLRRDRLQSEVNDLKASLQRELLRLDSSDVDAQGRRSRFASVPREKPYSRNETELHGQKRGKRSLVAVKAIDDIDYFAMEATNQVKLKGSEVASSLPSNYTAERVDRRESDEALQPTSGCRRSSCSPARESVEVVVAMESHPSDVAVFLEDLSQNVPTKRTASPHPVERSMPLEHDVESDRLVMGDATARVASPQSAQSPRSEIGGTRILEKYRLALEGVWEELLVGKAIAEEQERKLHLASNAAEQIRREAEDWRSMVLTYKEILAAQRRKSSLTNTRKNGETKAGHLRGGSDEVVSFDIENPIVVDGALTDCHPDHSLLDDNKSNRVETSLGNSIPARVVASLKPPQRSSNGRNKTWRRRRAHATLIQSEKEARLRSVILEVRLERKRRELARVIASLGINWTSTLSSKTKVDYDTDILRYRTLLRSANQIKRFWLRRLENRRESQVAVEGDMNEDSHSASTTIGSAEHVLVKTIQVLLEESQRNSMRYDRMRASALSQTKASLFLNRSRRIEQVQTIPRSSWNHQPRKLLPLVAEEANGDGLLSSGRFRRGSHDERHALCDTQRNARQIGIKASLSDGIVGCISSKPQHHSVIPHKLKEKAWAFRRSEQISSQLEQCVESSKELAPFRESLLVSSTTHCREAHTALRNRNAKDNQFGLMKGQKRFGEWRYRQFIGESFQANTLSVSTFPKVEQRKQMTREDQDELMNENIKDGSEPSTHLLASSGIFESTHSHSHTLAKSSSMSFSSVASLDVADEAERVWQEDDRDATQTFLQVLRHIHRKLVAKFGSMDVAYLKSASAPLGLRMTGFASMVSFTGCSAETARRVFDIILTFLPKGLTHRKHARNALRRTEFTCVMRHIVPVHNLCQLRNRLLWRYTTLELAFVACAATLVDDMKIGNSIIPAATFRNFCAKVGVVALEARKAFAEMLYHDERDSRVERIGLTRRTFMVTLSWAEELVASQRLRRCLGKLEKNQFGSGSRRSVEVFGSSAVASSTCSTSLAGEANFLNLKSISERNGSNLTDVEWAAVHRFIGLYNSFMKAIGGLHSAFQLVSELEFCSIAHRLDICRDDLAAVFRLGGNAEQKLLGDIVTRALGGLGYHHDWLREVVGMHPLPAGNVNSSASAFPRLQTVHNEQLTTCFPLRVARSASVRLNEPCALLISAMSTHEIGRKSEELETSVAETWHSESNASKESTSPLGRAGGSKVWSPVCVSNASLRSTREMPADFLCRGHSVLRSCISTENLSECFSLVQSSTTTWPDSVAESLESLPPFITPRPNTVGTKVRDRGPRHLEIVTKQLVRPRTTDQKLR